MMMWRSFCIAALLLTAWPAHGEEPALPERYSRPFLAPEDLSRWWTAFRDPHLERLVRLASDAHEEPRVAKARAAEMSAFTSQNRASLLPSGSISLTWTASQRSNNSPAIPRLEPPPGFQATQDLIPRRYSVMDGAANTTYESDLFGAQRKLTTAADFDRKAAEESWRDAVASLAAETARQYLEFREAQAMQVIVRRVLDSERLKLELVRRRVTAGLAGEADEHRAASRVAEVTAQLGQMEGRMEIALVLLSRLTGEPVSTLRSEMDAATEFPALRGQMAEAAPADLLRRRADVRRALLERSAATARRESAEKDWYPRFRLTANAGGQSGGIASLLSPQSILSSFAPGVSWGALNYRYTKSVIAQKRAAEQQQTESAAKVVLDAVRDVEQALARIADAERRQEHLQEMRAALARAAESERRRFAAGLGTMIPAIEAEVREASAEMDYVQTRASVLKQHVELYRALGGGW